MSPIAHRPAGRDSLRSGRDFADRRLFLGCAAGLCVSVCCANATEINPEQIVDYGAPVDVSGLSPGDWLIAQVEGKPVFVRRRTPDEIEIARSTPLAGLPDPARDEDRAPEREWIVVSGACTHAGCTVSGGLGPYQGWLCLCHGSIYDLSGRVRHGPAKKNLATVRYERKVGQMILLRS